MYFFSFCFRVLDAVCKEFGIVVVVVCSNMGLLRFGDGDGFRLDWKLESDGVRFGLKCLWGRSSVWWRGWWRVLKWVMVD